MEFLNTTSHFYKVFEGYNEQVNVFNLASYAVFVTWLIYNKGVKLQLQRILVIFDIFFFTFNTGGALTMLLPIEEIKEDNIFMLCRYLFIYILLHATIINIVCYNDIYKMCKHTLLLILFKFCLMVFPIDFYLLICLFYLPPLFDVPNTIFSDKVEIGSNWSLVMLITFGCYLSKIACLDINRIQLLLFYIVINLQLVFK